MQGDQVVDSSLHPGRVILTNLEGSLWLLINEELRQKKKKNGIGWSLGPRVAEVVLKMATRRG